MNLLKEEFEKIWEKLPCLSPSYFIKWNLTMSKYRGHKGLWIWAVDSIILRWMPGRLGGKRRNNSLGKGWHKLWRKP